MKIKNSHQFYRDVFTTPVTPISMTDMQQKHLCMGENNYESINEAFNFNFFGMDKLITLVNFSRDNSLGKNIPLEIKNYIKKLIQSILRKNPSYVQKIICAKSFFRLGYIDDFFLVINSDKEVEDSPDIKALVALVYIFDENYEESANILADLMEHPYFGNHLIVKVMMTIAFYKCGGVPEIPIDLSSLINGETESPREIDWIVSKSLSNKKQITVFTASDPVYFKEHALSNFLSYAQANRSNGSYHFHIYNANEEIIDAIKKLTIIFKKISITATSEIVDPHAKHLRAIYTINRFRAIHSIMGVLDGPIMAVDADSLWKKPLNSKTNENDLEFCGSPYSPFWENNIGGVCFFANSEPSRFFLGLMSKLISNLEKNSQGMWFQDQISLKIAEETLQKIFPSKVGRLEPNLWCDTSHSDNSILWQVTTRKDGEKYNDFKKQLNSLLRAANTTG